jgi:hypothetical protein
MTLEDGLTASGILLSTCCINMLFILSLISRHVASMQGLKIYVKMCSDRDDRGFPMSEDVLKIMAFSM